MYRLMRGLTRLGLVISLIWPVQSVAIGSDADIALIEATRQGNLDQVKSLLQQSADVNAVEADGTTALAWAVYNNDVNMVDLLLGSGADGADANAANDYGVTPLHLACTNQNAAIVSKLLKSGADPNLAKWTGETPLMTCAGTGAVDAVSELLANGADANAKEAEFEQTALMWAAAERHAGVVKLLIDKGADVSATSKLIPEPEPFFIETPGSMGINLPDTLRFRELTGGFNALQFAAQQGDIDSVKALLDAGADINFATREEGSALLIATAAGHEKLALYLLERGADPDITDAYGVAPLHFAVHKGLLIMNNWAPADTDKYGWERHNNSNIVKALLEKGAKPDPRVKHSWSHLDNPFQARAMEDPSQIDVVGSTPLLLAAASGDIESMKLLLKHGANRDAKTLGGATLFMLAAGAGAEDGARDEKQAIEAAKFVLSLGNIDVNAELTANDAKNGPGAGKLDGRNIMHFAVTLAWKDMIRFLDEQGVDLDHGDRYGMTPLMIAMGDPEARYYRNIPVGRYDDRYRRPRENEEIEALLLEVGAAPFTGKVVDKGSVD